MFAGEVGEGMPGGGGVRAAALRWGRRVTRGRACFGWRAGWRGGQDAEGKSGDGGELGSRGLCWAAKILSFIKRDPMEGLSFRKMTGNSVYEGDGELVC